jgi:hypothetical protein
MPETHCIEGPKKKEEEPALSPGCFAHRSSVRLAEPKGRRGRRLRRAEAGKVQSTKLMRRASFASCSWLCV